MAVSQKPSLNTDILTAQTAEKYGQEANREGLEILLYAFEPGLYACDIYRNFAVRKLHSDLGHYRAFCCDLPSLTMRAISHGETWQMPFVSASRAEL